MNKEMKTIKDCYTWDDFNGEDIKFLDENKLYEMLLEDFLKCHDYVMMQSDKTNREYWILTEWKTSIDKIIKDLI